jgi:hypothetical protein
MSQAASQYAAFWRDVRVSRKVWTVTDDDGVPAPKTRTGQRAMPFWSSLRRVQKIIRTVPAYGSFVPKEMAWEEFRDEWLADLEHQGLLVGVNWSGLHALGYDVSPADMRLAGAAIVDKEAGGAPPETTR